MKANADVLLWSINNTASVDNSSIASFISPLPDDDDNWAVGRVKVTTSTGVVKYFDMVDPGSATDPYPTYYSGEEGVYIGGGGTFFGAEWNQTVLASDIGTGALFAIELGMNHYDPLSDTINFELLAMTNPATYDTLQRFMYPQGSLAPLTATPWTPTQYYTVPEPNSLLLVLYGLGILALTRRHA